MKKIFTLFAAMLVALTVSATSTTIGSDNPKDTHADAISAVVSSYDTIFLKPGIYTESGRIAVSGATKVIKAISDTVILKATKDYQVTNGAKVTYDGIFFDGSTIGSYRGFTTADATAGKEYRFNNCEFYSFPKYVITTNSESCSIDSVIVTGCYFHNNTRGSIYFPASNVDNQETCYGLIVKNSTFANNDASGDWTSIIDFESKGNASAEDVQLLVDHCTFYNNLTKNSDHASVRSNQAKTTKVSNCIFAHPERYERRATYLIANPSYAQSCITFNLKSDSANVGHTWMTQRTNCFFADPLFANAANGNLTLAENSPAVDAGTDGKTLGDPRWWPVIVYPQTDFDEGYAFTGTAASLESGLIKEDHWGAGREYIRYDGGMHSFAAASWTVEATRACFVKVKVYTATNSWEDHTSSPYGNSGHNFSVELWNEDGQRLDTIIEAPYQPSPWDGNRNYPADGIELGTIIVPAAGIYTIKLKNMRDFSRCGVDSVTFTYLNDIPTVKSHGSWDYDHDAIFDLAEDGKSASTTLNLAQSNTNYSFKMVIGEEWRANGHNYNREYTSASGITSNGNDMSIYVNYTGEHKLTWYFKENKFEITFPVIPDPVFYVAGTFTDWETNKVAMTEEAGICTASIPLEANIDTYAYKILKIDAWGTKTWYGAENEGARMTFGNSTNWQLTTTGGGQNINLTSTLEGDYPFIFNAADAHMSVTIPDPSATDIDNTVVGEKAVKRMENGQLVIIKNGVRYNVLGTVIK